MPSTRRVATDLGVATMSLCRHVSSEDELVLLTADRSSQRSHFPRNDRQIGASAWRSQLVLCGQSSAGIHGRPRFVDDSSAVTPNLLAFAEWSLTTLRKLGNAQRIDHAVALSE
jgi:hypothetical protein